MTWTALAKEPGTSLRKDIAGSCTSMAGVHLERPSAAEDIARHWRPPGWTGCRLSAVA
jgi:hypothetical protein